MNVLLFFASDFFFASYFDRYIRGRTGGLVWVYSLALLSPSMGAILACPLARRPHTAVGKTEIFDEFIGDFAKLIRRHPGALAGLCHAGHTAHAFVLCFVLRFAQKTQTCGRRPIEGPQEIQREDPEPYKDHKAPPQGEMSETGSPWVCH